MPPRSRPAYTKLSFPGEPKMKNLILTAALAVFSPCRKYVRVHAMSTTGSQNHCPGQVQLLTSGIDGY